VIDYTRHVFAPPDPVSLSGSRMSELMARKEAVALVPG
jgi:hypothetical protein